jgi:predicted RND superfamily exporter protein
MKYESIKHSFLILPILGLALSDVRLFLASVVPNLLPTAFALAFAVWMDIPLRIGTAIVMAIALGIAVDDTIHLMMRLKSLTKNGLAPAAAVAAVIGHTGVAILYTSFVLVIGFLTMLSNDLLAIRDMGVVAAATLFVAFLSDAYLAPAVYLTLSKAARKSRHAAYRREPRPALFTRIAIKWNEPKRRTER